MNNQYSIAVALIITTNLIVTPSNAQDFRGRVIPQCAVVAIDPNLNSVGSIGNRGSVTTICNTGSTLSVTAERTATTPPTSDAKIRFAAGGTGIYRYANQQQEYRSTVTFSSQDVTSTTGDTAIFETNILNPLPNSTIVYPVLTAQ